MLCTLSCFYSAHLLFVVFIVEVIDGSPLTYCLVPTCSPPCIHFVCMPVCYLYSLLHPELHWTQRIKEKWKYEWDQWVYWWCTDTPIQRLLTNINASLLGRVLSWVPVFPVLELVISGFLFSEHYHHNTLKNNIVFVIYICVCIYIYKCIIIFFYIFFLPWLYRWGHEAVCHCRFPWGWWDRTVPCWGMSLCHH